MSTGESDRPSNGVSMKESSNSDEFVPSVGLTEAQATKLLERWGKNELPEKVVPKVSIIILSRLSNQSCILTGELVYLENANTNLILSLT
jgi:hypothetical protein